MLLCVYIYMYKKALNWGEFNSYIHKLMPKCICIHTYVRRYKRTHVCIFYTLHICLFFGPFFGRFTRWRGATLPFPTGFGCWLLLLLFLFSSCLVFLGGSSEFSCGFWLLFHDFGLLFFLFRCFPKKHTKKKKGDYVTRWQFWKCSVITSVSINCVWCFFDFVQKWQSLLNTLSG